MSVLSHLLKSAGLAVTVDGSTGKTFSCRVFSDRDEELRLAVQDSLGFDGFNVWHV